jgi:chitinase
LIELLKEYREQWKAFPERQYELTVAMPYARQEYLAGNKLKTFSDMVDYILVMGYEFQFGSEVTRHQANIFPTPGESPNMAKLNVDTGIQSYLKGEGGVGFPPNKVILGVPCYGRGFADADKGQRNGLGAPFKGAVGDIIAYSNISQLTGSFQEFYDDTSKGAYFYSETTRMFYSIETHRSVLDKTKYVNDRNLGGIMLWDIATGELLCLARIIFCIVTDILLRPSLL